MISPVDRSKWLYTLSLTKPWMTLTSRPLMLGSSVAYHTPIRSHWSYFQSYMAWYFPISIYDLHYSWNTLWSPKLATIWHNGSSLLTPQMSIYYFFLSCTLRCTLHATQQSFIGSYVISISTFPVFHVNNLDLILQHLRLQDNFPPSTVTIIIAPEWQSSLDIHPNVTLLHLHDLCHISALQLITWERSSTAEFVRALSERWALIPADQIVFFINRLQSSIMTDEEWALPKLTHCHLCTLPNWNVWDLACDKQLDAHHSAGAFLKPMPWPIQLPGVCLNILWFHWTYAVKDDNTWKAWATMDGSTWAALWGCAKLWKPMHLVLISPLWNSSLQLLQSQTRFSSLEIQQMLSSNCCHQQNPVLGNWQSISILV